METPQQVIRQSIEATKHGIFNSHGMSMYDRDQVEKFVERHVHKAARAQVGALIQHVIDAMRTLRGQMDSHDIEDWREQPSDVLYLDMPLHAKQRAKLSIDTIIMDLESYLQIMRAVAQGNGGNADDDR